MATEPRRSRSLAVSRVVLSALAVAALLAGGAGAATPPVDPVFRVAGPTVAAPDAFAEPQAKRLTLEVLFHPDGQVDFTGDVPRALEWIDAERYLQPAPERQEGARVLVVDARSGESEPFFDAARMEDALAALPGMGRDAARELSRQTSFTWNRDHTAILLNHANDLFHYDLEAGHAVRLTTDPAAEVGEEYSPDGLLVSFVRDHDLHLVDVATQRERALTDDGGPELFYGRLDWVYQEELYGRGNFKGYWWSPDSRRIALLKLDESPVEEFTVVDHIPNPVETEVTNYPKAGSPNPAVELGVVDAVGGGIAWVDTTRYQPIQHLIVRVGWTPDSSGVVFQVQDREQTWLELLRADPASGEAEVLLREKSPAFVEVAGEPRWLPDGTFLWLSARSGYQHVYRYGTDGELRGAVTEGEWEVRDLEGVDDAGRVYFEATEHSSIAPHVYRVGLDGAGLQRLSTREGSHAANFDPSFSLYLDTWSDATTPPRVTLHEADGAEVRTVFANEEARQRLADYELGDVEFLQVPARDGFEMEAMVIRPPDFDPARKYPVLQYNYGGPHAPVVRDAWGGTRYMWHQLLAQHGYVIWMCDNRSASGKGIAPTWEAYRQMGVVELRDIEDGIDWLESQPWFDASRMGIWGWSYGGFMAAYALTHSTRFKAGIAGAPVTDWRLYDTIYTERYMAMPQNNPEGYDATSVVESAANLHGKLLIVHGTMDDNVHLQNSMQLVYELQKAGKDFELMLYPRSRHGVREPELVYHLQRLMTRFILENL